MAPREGIWRLREADPDAFALQDFKLMDHTFLGLQARTLNDATLPVGPVARFMANKPLRDIRAGRRLQQAILDDSIKYKETCPSQKFHGEHGVVVVSAADARVAHDGPRRQRPMLELPGRGATGQDHESVIAQLAGAFPNPRRAPRDS